MSEEDLEIPDCVYCKCIYGSRECWECPEYEDFIDEDDEELDC